MNWVIAQTFYGYICSWLWETRRHAKQCLTYKWWYSIYLHSTSVWNIIILYVFQSCINSNKYVFWCVFLFFSHICVWNWMKVKADYLRWTLSCSLILEGNTSRFQVRWMFICLRRKYVTEKKKTGCCVM